MSRNNEEDRDADHIRLGAEGAQSLKWSTLMGSVSQIASLESYWPVKHYYCTEKIKIFPASNTGYL